MGDAARGKRRQWGRGRGGRRAGAKSSEGMEEQLGSAKKQEGGNRGRGRMDNNGKQTRVAGKLKFTRKSFCYYRFVRFVNTPDVLERVSIIEAELTQLEETMNMQSKQPVDQQLEKMTIPASTTGNVSPMLNSAEKPMLLIKARRESLDNRENGTFETSKIQLLKALDSRRLVLQKEQGMAFARAMAAAFHPEGMSDLVAFAECFGATRLREASIKYVALYRKKQDSVIMFAEMSTIHTDALGSPDTWSDNGGRDKKFDESCLSGTNKHQEHMNIGVVDGMQSGGGWNFTNGNPSTPENQWGRSPVDPSDAQGRYVQSWLSSSMNNGNHFPLDGGFQQGVPPPESWYFSEGFRYANSTTSPFGQSNPSPGVYDPKAHVGAEEEESREMSLLPSKKTSRRTQQRHQGVVVIHNLNYVAQPNGVPSSNSGDSDSPSRGCDEERASSRVANHPETLVKGEHLSEEFALIHGNRSTSSNQRHLSSSYVDREPNADSSTHVQRRESDSWLPGKKGELNKVSFSSCNAEFGDGFAARFRGLANADDNACVVVGERGGFERGGEENVTRWNLQHPSYVPDKRISDDSFIVPSRTTNLGWRPDTVIESEVVAHNDSSIERTKSNSNDSDMLMILRQHPKHRLSNGSCKTGYDIQICDDMIASEEFNRKADSEGDAINRGKDGKRQNGSDPKTRDAKLKQVTGKIPGRDGKLKTATPMQRSLKSDRRSPQMEAQIRADKLRAYKADLMKNKRQKDEEERKRIEELKNQRKQRIAARSNGLLSGVVRPTTLVSARQTSVNKFPRKVGPLLSTSSTIVSASPKRLPSLTTVKVSKATTTTSTAIGISPNSRRIPSQQSKTSVKMISSSLPSLAELRKNRLSSSDPKKVVTQRGGSDQASRRSRMVKDNKLTTNSFSLNKSNSTALDERKKRKLPPVSKSFGSNTASKKSFGGSTLMKTREKPLTISKMPNKRQDVKRAGSGVNGVKKEHRIAPNSRLGGGQAVSTILVSKSMIGNSKPLVAPDQTRSREVAKVKTHSVNVKEVKPDLTKSSMMANDTSTIKWARDSANEWSLDKDLSNDKASSVSGMTNFADVSDGTQKKFSYAMPDCSMVKGNGQMAGKSGSSSIFSLIFSKQGH